MNDRTSAQRGLRYRQRHPDKWREIQRTHGNRRREAISELKRGRPCMDCGGVFHPTVMDFDHRPGTTKKFNVANGIRSKGWNETLAEIAKCDLVCANCHRMRTWKRQQRGFKP